MKGGIGPEGDKYHIVNFAEDSGEAVAVDETSALAIFVAPRACTIIEISLAVTTAIAAHSTNTWSIQIVNQTGDASLLSTAFDTDSDNSGNGGRAFTADTLTSLNDNGSGNNYLQYATLAKGDVLVLTATMANTPTAMANPQILVQWR